MSQEVEIIAGLILLSQVVNAFLTFHTARKEATKPWQDLKDTDIRQQEQIGEIKRDIQIMKSDLNHAFDKARDMEKNSLVLQRGVLALIYHELDGNHTQVLEEAKKELEDIIWKKS